MQTLCPACGTRNRHHWSPLPPRCSSCKRKLPFTLPRNAVYAFRTLWRPALILSLGGALLLVSPYSGKHSFNIIPVKATIGRHP